MKLRDIMTCNVEAIGPELTVQEAAKKMRSLDVISDLKQKSRLRRRIRHVPPISRSF
jgi:CBS domain-containing protein